MDPVIGGALISAGSKLAGGLLGLAGAEKNNHRGREAREAVYNSVAQRVKAARDWGISPLYALGAPTYSGAISTGGDNGLGSLGASLSDMGADIGRAVAAGQSEEERAIQRLTLEKAALENDYLRAQIGSVRVRTMREVGPPLPDDGHKIVPPQRTSHYRILGVPLRRSPWQTDAQTLEDVGGEGAATAIGPLAYPMDAYYTMWQNFMDWSRGGGSMKGMDNRRKTGYYGR